MRTRLLTGLALTLGLAACGGPLLFAELELPSVEVTLPQYSFPGTPPGVPLTKDIGVDIAANVPTINEKNVEYELRLEKMWIVLDTSGPMSNFDSVDRVTISALPPAGSGRPELVLIDYVNPHTATGVTRITASSSTGADLKPYLSAGQLTLRSVYSGAGLPTSTWTADVTADFSLKITLDYGAYL